MFTDNEVLNNTTVDNFKTQFDRDFPYLPLWVAGTYNTGEEIYYLTNRLFYTALEDLVDSVPGTAGDWLRSSNTSVYDYISDSDITKAFNKAKSMINPAIFYNDDILQLAYLYLSAHYLSINIRTSQNGVSSIGEQVVSSKSVGSVSESYAIPDLVLKNPILLGYTKTTYGQQYLEMVLPLIVGAVGVVGGATLG